MSGSHDAPGGAAETVEQLAARIAEHRAALSEEMRTGDPRQWALLQVRLGDALRELCERLRLGGERAVSGPRTAACRAYDAALGAGEHLEALERIRILAHRGHLLLKQHGQSHAIASCEAALGELAPGTAPELRGIAQRNWAEATLAPFLPDHEGTVGRTGAAATLAAAVEMARGAVASLAEAGSPRLPLAEITLVRALTALGAETRRPPLIAEAVAIAREALARQSRARSLADWIEAQMALGDALLAGYERGGSKDGGHTLEAAVEAYYSGLNAWYSAASGFRQQPRHGLGRALTLLAGRRAQVRGLGWLAGLLAGRRGAIRARLAEQAAALAGGSTAGDRLAWALDALAVADAHCSMQRTLAMQVLDDMKELADRHREPRLWEAWATGLWRLQLVPEAKPAVAARHAALRAVLEHGGSPELRLLWAETRPRDERSRRPAALRLAELAEQHAMARKHDDRALLEHWAALAALEHGDLYKSAPDAAEALRSRLETEAREHGSPALWSAWALACCDLLQDASRTEADPAAALALLVEARSHLGDDSPAVPRWANAAMRVHAALRPRDMTAADRLRAELAAVAASTRDGEARQAWRVVTIGTIRDVRMQDYALARALLAELEATGGEEPDHGTRRALDEARKLIRDPAVRLAHGLVGEVLKPVRVASDAVAIADGTRASRIDASAAGALAHVGRNVYCRELNLAGTAIAALPDDLTVLNRLDVSQCRQMRRLPARLKVDRLVARQCLALEALPGGIETAYLDLTGCSALTALPDDLVVRRGRLTLRDCTRLERIPESVGPLAQLDIAGCLNITALPVSLAVTAWIDIGGSGITGLPPHLADVGLRWRGVQIDARIAFRPETLDHREILAEENVERRRVMLERFGLDRFMRDAGARVLDSDLDAGGPRRLLRIEIPGDEPLVCVSVVCPSTARQFMLRVPPTTTSCRAAVAWTAGFDDPDDYRPAVET